MNLELLLNLINRKMNRIKIYTDRHKIAEFERSVNETIEAGNSLIDIFHEFQPFMRINSVMDFETLVDDPGPCMITC